MKNKHIRLVAIDADFTLLNDKRQISRENKEAVARLASEGVRVVLCSGRSYASLRDFSEELGLLSDENYIVSFNGGLVQKAKSGDIIREVKLKKEYAKEITKICKGYPTINTAVYKDIYNVLVLDDTPYATEYSKIAKVNRICVEDLEEAITEDVVKVLQIGHPDHLKEQFQAVNKLGELPYNMFFSTTTLLEFTPMEATKGQGLEFLCNHLGILPQETAAVGDNFNDISMLDFVGIGVAVKNAEDDLKAVADFVTENNNNESAVAEAINQIFGY